MWGAWQGLLGANPIEKITRELGDWALRLLIVTLAITPLRWWVNMPKMMGFRRMLGLFTFFYALLHMSSYLVLDQFFEWAEIWEDIVKRPYITIGMLDFVMLLLLAVTSTNGMMRRLGRNWKRLHRLIYPVAALSVIHFWLLVKADILEPLIYALIVVGLLGYRLYRAGRLPFWQRVNG